MLTPEDRGAVAAQTRVLKIIIGALLAGPLAFLAFVISQPDDGPPEAGNLTLMAGGFAALQLVLAVLVPRIVAHQHRAAVVDGRPLARNQPPAANDAAALLGSFQIRRIIGAALLEGAAFFNIVAYRSERVPYTLAIALALVAGIAVLFPLRSSVEDWLDRELRTVNELRTLRG